MAADPTKPDRSPDAVAAASTIGAASSDETLSGDTGTAQESLPVVSGVAYARSREIARGGLGRIIEAEDRRLRRVVALKELRRRTPDAAARFVREAMVTARLQHPGVVPIYEAGRWPDGEPFYAMKLVSGTSLAEAIAARATLDERLALIPNVIAVADTIAYAHAQRIIHRDLKPHNVMLGEFGETVVIDWGLAKDLDVREEPVAVTAPPTGESSSTVEGTVLGTPAYMPPEQALGEVVDERADVYALGAMLYHVLAGAPPYEGSTVLAGPPPPLDARVAGVPRDLAAIVAKAMARAAAGRYPSARELADDLRRFQTGKLVSVRDYTTTERLLRWVRRHRATVTVAALALIALAVSGVVAIRRILAATERASRERTVAVEARRLAEERESDLTLLHAQSQLERDPTATLGWVLELPDARLDAGAATVAADATSRGVAAHVIRLFDGRVRHVVVDGGRALAIGRGGQVVELDLVTGATREVWKAGEPTLALAAHGRTTVVTTATTLHVLDGDRVVRSEALDSPVLMLALAPDARAAATGTLSGRVRLWTIALGAPGAPVELGGFAGEIRAIAWSPDGAHLAAASYDGGVAVWRVADGARVVESRHASTVWALAWSPDGRALATACEDGTARILTLDGARARELAGHAGPVLDVAFDARGERVATASRDDTVRLWSRGGALLGVLPHHDDVWRVRAAPDGRGWASAGADKRVRLWDPDGGAERVLGGHEDFVSVLAYSADGALLVSAGQDGSARVWRTASDHEVVARGAALAAVSADRVARVQDGRLLVDGVDVADARGLEWLRLDGDTTVASDAAGRVVLVGPAGVEELRAGAQLGAVARVGAARFGAGYDGKLWWWTDAAATPTALPGHESYVLDVAAIPGQGLVVTGGADQTVRVWDTGGRVVRVLKEHTGPVHHVAASPDGALIAGGDGDGVVVVWRVADGARVARWSHGGFVRDLAFAAAGDRLASVGDDKVVHVWHADGRLLSMTGHLQTASTVAFSADGRLVAAGGLDATIRVWDVDTGAARVLRGHTGGIRAVAIAADGASLVSAAADGTIRRWPRDAFEPPPVAPRALRAWIAARTSAAIGPSGTPRSP